MVQAAVVLPSEALTREREKNGQWEREGERGSEMGSERGGREDISMGWKSGGPEAAQAAGGVAVRIVTCPLS